MAIYNGPLTEYIKNMENKPIMQITTQLTTYDIQVKQMTRTAYPETGGTTKVEYTQYNILDNGQLVGFVFDENDIEAAINGIENPGRRPYGTRFD